MGHEHDDEITEAEIREACGTVAALMQAYMSGDEDGYDRVVNALDEHRDALGVAVGIAVELGHIAYGSHERFAAAVAAWPPGGMLPTPDELDV